MLGSRKGAEAGDAGPKGSCGEGSRRDRAGGARWDPARPEGLVGAQWDSLFPRQGGPGRAMQSPAGKKAGGRGPRERTGKGSLEERAKRAQPLKPGWALTLEGMAAMSPAQRHRHLLFGDLLEDVGAAASIFTRESVELGCRMPDPRAWATQSLEPPGARQDRLLGVLKAAEARGRIRALRLRYIRMRVRLGPEGRGAQARRLGAERGGDTSSGALRKGVGEDRSGGGRDRRAGGGGRLAGGGGLSQQIFAEAEERPEPPRPAPRRTRRSRCSSCSRSPRAPPSGWSCSYRRS